MTTVVVDVRVGVVVEFSATGAVADLGAAVVVDVGVAEFEVNIVEVVNGVVVVIGANFAVDVIVSRSVGGTFVLSVPFTITLFAIVFGTFVDVIFVKSSVVLNVSSMVVLSEVLSVIIVVVWFVGLVTIETVVDSEVGVSSVDVTSVEVFTVETVDVSSVEIPDVSFVETVVGSEVVLISSVVTVEVSSVG